MEASNTAGGHEQRRPIDPPGRLGGKKPTRRGRRRRKVAKADGAKKSAGDAIQQKPAAANAPPPDSIATADAQCPRSMVPTSTSAVPNTDRRLREQRAEAGIHRQQRTPSNHQQKSVKNQRAETASRRPSFTLKATDTNCQRPMPSSTSSAIKNPRANAVSRRRKTSFSSTDAIKNMQEQTVTEDDSCIADDRRPRRTPVSYCYFFGERYQTSPLDHQVGQIALYNVGHKMTRVEIKEVSRQSQQSQPFYHVKALNKSLASHVPEVLLHDEIFISDAMYLDLQDRVLKGLEDNLARLTLRIRRAT